MNGVRLMHGLAALFATVAGVVALGGLLFWLAQRPYFALRAIEVRGDLLQELFAHLQSCDTEPPGRFGLLSILSALSLDKG